MTTMIGVMNTNMSEFAKTIMLERYSHIKKDGTKETWEEISNRVAKTVLRTVDADKTLIDATKQLILHRKFIPGGRYLNATGMPFHQVQNCILLKGKDSREGWSELLSHSSMALMTGAGMGANYSDIRCKNMPIRKTGGITTGPIPLMQMVNEIGRGVRAGGNRRGAIWAGLNWKHADIHEFIRAKDWLPEIRALKEKNVDFPASLDMTNISVCLDDEFFKAYHDDKHQLNGLARAVYTESVRRMLKTGEPGFSIDLGNNSREVLRNACTEITSTDDSDICNLGSLNLANFDSLAEFEQAVEVATAFLLAGTVYSDVPYYEVDLVRTKNRRLGLGLMGIHEWLLKHNKVYKADDDLTDYLKVYTRSDYYAKQYAKKWSLSCPIKTRAIAPNGTTGIVAETTTGIEPIFCVALKRRYAKGDSWHYQYILDPTAKRLIDGGMNPESIEDAYSLAENVERRIAFQAYIQSYVDHAISSTINLPAWGTELNNENKVDSFASLLINYLPALRGITCYPDGARGGQPLQSVKYSTALKHIGQKFVVEQMDVCDITKAGSCG